MRTAAPPNRPCTLDTLSPQDVQMLLTGAQIAATDAASLALGKRHVAVLCEEPVCESADALAAAAAALGATVVRLRASSLHLDGRLQVRDTARVLGRLYHLIGCEGLAPAVCAGLSRWAGVPVLSEVAAPFHATRILADLLVMQERTMHPAAQITLGLRGDTSAAAVAAWRQAARLTGVRLVNLGLDPADVGQPPCDFYACPAPGDPARLPLRLAVVGPAAQRGDSLVEPQRDAHRRLLQSLLTNLSG